MKYKTFAEFKANLKVGDLVTLNNGTVITVTDINNLFELNIIKGISSYNSLIVEYDLFHLYKHGKLSNYIEEIHDTELFEATKEDHFEVLNNNRILQNEEKKITYKDLFQMMERADKTLFKYSRYFWQYTHIDNLKQILIDGKFKSRSNLKGNIPFNIKEFNDTANQVMSSNLSWRLQHHVRFYLRPTNAPFFSAKCSFQNEDDIVYIAISKDALYRSNNSTFLYPKNAHGAKDKDLEKENELNCKYGKPFILHNYELFNFEETYSFYEKNQSNNRKNYQQAEFLVWKDLPTTFIEFIFFRSIAAKHNFLNSIKNTPCYNNFKDICLVNRDLFYAEGYK